MSRPVTPISPDTDPILQELDGIIAHSGLPLADIAAQAGCTYGMLWSWRTINRSPNLAKLRAVCDVLGYEIKLTRKKP